MYKFTHTYSGAFSQNNQYIGTIAVTHNINPAGNSFPDAPEDSKIYGRENGEWVEVDSGGGSSATNLGYTASPTNGIVTSDTGNDATIPAANSTNAGLLLPAEKTKIGEIDLKEVIFFDDITVQAKISRPYNFTILAKTETEGTGTITTSTDAAYVLGATVNANGYLKITASAVNTIVYLTLTRV